VLARQRTKTGRRLLRPETPREVGQRDAPVPRIQPVGQPAAESPKPRHHRQRQRLQPRHQGARQQI